MGLIWCLIAVPLITAALLLVFKGEAGASTHHDWWSGGDGGDVGARCRADVHR